MSAETTFTTAYQADTEYLYIAGSLDGLEDFAPFTRLFVYEHDKRIWTHHDVKWYCIAVTKWWKNKTSPTLCAMSEEGNVEVIDSYGVSAFEKIPGAGVFSEDAEGWGYQRTETNRRAWRSSLCLRLQRSGV
jgi:hypothetical protein